MVRSITSFALPILLEFVVAPSCFYPPPKVRSAIIRLTPRRDKAGIDMHAFSTFVKMVFQKRRKMLRSILPGCDFGSIPPTARPEELGVGEFVELYRKEAARTQ